MRAYLDVETEPTVGDLSNGYALEPWRARQGLARISSLGIKYPNNCIKQIERPSADQLVEALYTLQGQEVVCHNAMFDVAWLIASIEPNKLKRVPEIIRNTRWRDSMLLTKWVINGRKADDAYVKYALINLCMMFLPNEPGLKEFIAIKQGVVLDSNNPYWLRRNELDLEWTQKLYELMWSKLPESSQRGFIIEQRAIQQLANSWLIGMWVDQDAFKAAELAIADTIRVGCAELGLSREVISSPQQLGRVVFGAWGFTPARHTPTGSPGTAADDFILLAHSCGDKRLRRLLEVKQALTLESKYIKVARDALARTNDGYLYGIPRLFGTTSGRLTYSSETAGQFKVSIAQHQIPRKDKIIRRYLSPPPGANLFEADAAAQESRIMGIWSRDPEIIRVFRSGINFHSSMAAHIFGRAYEELQAAVKAEEPKAVEQRQLGKLTNLSCNFRIGGPKLAKKALTEYDTYLTDTEGRMLVRAFQEKYQGVPQYWRAIIEFAKQHGYSYTLAQRRWKVPIEMMNSGDAWKLEGTVISHPIQGSGAEMYLAAMSQVPEARIQTTLHDGVFFIVDDQVEADHIAERMQATPYEDLWQLNEPLPIPLLYEFSRLGSSFADVK